jgi:hypothetical protein
MPQDIQGSFRVADFEVAVIGRQPAVHDFGDIYLGSRRAEPPGRFLATRAGVAFNRYRGEHRIVFGGHGS